MRDKLNETPVDDLLPSQSAGRIDYTDGKKLYNPEVCFEVDVTTSMGNWRSIMVSGKLAILPGKRKRKRK
jgi:hypothetical protein